MDSRDPDLQPLRVKCHLATNCVIIAGRLALIWSKHTVTWKNGRTFSDDISEEYFWQTPFAYSFKFQLNAQLFGSKPLPEPNIRSISLLAFIYTETEFNDDVSFVLTLQWRHNEHDGVSNHQPHECLLKRLFRRRSKKTSKPRVTGLCEGKPLVIGEFPAQRTSNTENVSIWWRHHDLLILAATIPTFNSLTNHRERCLLF